MAKGKRETTDRVSRIAGRLLRAASDFADDDAISSLYGGCSARVTFGELRALAASCLAQDETKGKRTAPKPRKRKARK